MSRSIVLAVLWFAALAPQTRTPQGFRGNGSGCFSEATPPREWSAAKNVVWTTKIGPNKYSSPVVVDGRVFLVAEPADLFCVDAADGRILWQRSNGFADLPGKIEGKLPKNDAGNTTPTPVSDGRYVYAVFGTGIVACYDFEGRRQWIWYDGPHPAPEYGRTASPALSGDKLLVTLSCLIALDARTGKPIWKNKEILEQYGTPVPTMIAGVDVAVMPSGQVVRVVDGAILAADLGGLLYASPVVEDGIVYRIQAASSAQKLVATASDKWEARQVWEQELEGTFYASAICDRGLIYAVSNEGFFTILDARDGKILDRRELDLSPEGGNQYPSLVLAGNHLLIFNDRGDALVLQPGRTYKELARNRLGAGHGSAPAFDGRHIYVRGGQNLYCIGEAGR